ncbi:hypothetical protein TNCV_3268331 [Trichonephila clavipes]|nr:hypothetical protein TNCV_3268331 [Trichonephila clavipes]
MAKDERQLQVSNFSPKFSLHDIISRASELGKIENVVTETSAGNSGLGSNLLACFIKFKDGSLIPLAEASSNFPGCYVKYKFNGSIRKKEAFKEARSDLVYLTSSCFDTKKKILDQIVKDASKAGEVYNICNKDVIVAKASCLTESDLVPRNPSQQRASYTPVVSRGLAQFHSNFEGEYSGGNHVLPTSLLLSPTSREDLRLDNDLEYPYASKAFRVTKHSTGWAAVIKIFS